MTVTNINGKEIDFEAAVTLMDDDIREMLHNSQEWADDQEFFTAYEKSHEEKYGAWWELSKENPVW